MKNKTNDTQKKKRSPLLRVILKILLTAIAAGAFFVAGMLVSLLLMGEDIHQPIIYAVTFGLPALLLPVIWVKNRKKFLKLWLIPAVLCLVVMAADLAVVKHGQSISVETARYDDLYFRPYEYEPFAEDTKAVRLEDASLQLTGDVPVIDGATALIPMYASFVRAVYPDTTESYDGIYKHTSQSVVEYLSEWGYRELADGQTDVFFDLYPSDACEAYAEPYGAEFLYTTVGTEAMVFFVHKDNPVDSLTVDQLRGIYSGDITNWKEVGGRNKKITAYQSDTGSCSQVMMERFMGSTPLMSAPTEKGYEELYAYVDMISKYKNRPGSIGYSFRYLVEDNPEIKILSVDGAAPTTENIQNGAYGIVTPIYAVTCRGNTNENLAGLLDWILTDEGQYILAQSGYAGVAPAYFE